MTGEQDVVVRRADHGDVERLACILGNAFADSPWTRWTVDSRDRVRRISALQLLAMEHVGLPYGEVWVATVDDVVEAGAVWMDSAVPVPPAAWAAMAEAQAELEGDRHVASIDAEEKTKPLRPEGHHYYLATVGTSPWRQRQGLGGRVLAPVLARADETETSAFLETSTEANVRFYTAKRFEVVATCELAADGPTVWAMLRTAARI